VFVLTFEEEEGCECQKESGTVATQCSSHLQSSAHPSAFRLSIVRGRMNTTAAGRDVYALGHSEHELERLSRQAEVFLPFTRQLFEQAGIGPGMRVLDVGSGAGDVSFLAADLVGPGGRVIGVDCAEVAVAWASMRARSREIGNVSFQQGDPADMEFSQQFDAIVGRFVLMYYPDPTAAIRKLARHLRSMGLMAFQEFDMDYVRSRPSAPTFERAAEIMKRTLRMSGSRIELGSELYPVFIAAGLPEPSLRIDVLIGGGAQFQGYDLMAGTIQSLLPVMEKLGIANASEIDVPTLAARMRDEVVAGKGVALSPALIGAWCRKSGSD
jgi:ubiquinone/menaquinone biosynthesis C-methylase UbiE